MCMLLAWQTIYGGTDKSNAMQKQEMEAALRQDQTFKSPVTGQPVDPAIGRQMLADRKDVQVILVRDFCMLCCNITATLQFVCFRTSLRMCDFYRIKLRNSPQMRMVWRPMSALGCKFACLLAIWYMLLHAIWMSCLRSNQNPDEREPEEIPTGQGEQEDIEAEQSGLRADNQQRIANIERQREIIIQKTFVKRNVDLRFVYDIFTALKKKHNSKMQRVTNESLMREKKEKKQAESEQDTDSKEADGEKVESEKERASTATKKTRLRDSEMKKTLEEANNSLSEKIDSINASMAENTRVMAENDSKNSLKMFAFLENFTNKLSNGLMAPPGRESLALSLSLSLSPLPPSLSSSACLCCAHPS